MEGESTSAQTQAMGEGQGIKDKGRSGEYTET